MTADTPITLYRSNRIYQGGIRLHDLRLFCGRQDDVVYFYNGKSLKDGDLGLLFGGGLISTSVYPPHQHLAPLVISPAPGTTLLDCLLTAANGLVRVDVYRNGYLQDDPNDYSINLNTGIITLVSPSLAGERFVLLREQWDTSATTTTHTHLTPLRIAPAPGTTLIDILLTDPVYNGADIYRNGMLQTDPDDYSLDTSTGFATLVIPTLASELFRVLRRANI
jgi:hypothetical protein